MSNGRKMKAEQLYEIVMDKMDLTRDIGDEELMELIHQVIREAAEEEYMPLKEQIRLSRQLFHSFRKLDVLQELVEDETITEIMINGTDEIFLEREGRIIQSDRKFMSIEKLEDVIQQIVAGTNRYVNELSPIVDARLEDGSRVNVVLKPVALNGPIMTIRKFPKDTVTMDQLISWGSVTEEVVEFVKMIVKAKYNIFVSGGTGSGKTTFLNAMSDYIPKDERIITIEDNAELQIRGQPGRGRRSDHPGSHQVGPANASGKTHDNKESLKAQKKCVPVPSAFGYYFTDNFVTFFIGEDG